MNNSRRHFKRTTENSLRVDWNSWKIYLEQVNSKAFSRGVSNQKQIWEGKIITQTKRKNLNVFKICRSNNLDPLRVQLLTHDLFIMSMKSQHRNIRHKLIWKRVASGILKRFYHLNFVKNSSFMRWTWAWPNVKNHKSK